VEVKKRISNVRIIALTATLLLLQVSCTRTGRVPPALPPDSQDRAMLLFQEVQTQRAAGNLEEAAQAVRDLVNGYPGFERMDEALFVAGELAAEQGRHADAAVHFEALYTEYPLSPRRTEAMLAAARAHERLGSYEKSATVLLELFELPVDPGVRARAEEMVLALIRTRLGPGELESLSKRFARSPLNREFALQLARKEYARGKYDRCYELLVDFLDRYPDAREAVEARRLLGQTSEKLQARPEPPSGPVNPNAFGVVLPVTGTLSLYGRDFEEGVRMAVSEFNERGGEGARAVKFVSADTKGTAVGAVRAVRKLVLEDGVIGIVGAVFTVPTIAAAIEANAWRTALISPVVSVDDLLEIGPWIFETKVPVEVEVAAMANMIVARLGMERFAIVAPSRGRGRIAGDLFGEEISRLGGEMVVAEYYEEGATDFRAQLEKVREAAAEALFIPGSVEELLTLLPQVGFYDLHVQLLGLSNWNSDRLLRLYKGELEGVLFPQESYHGKDPEAYQRLRATLMEKGSGEVNSITVCGYFGARLLLEAVAAGATDREDVRAYLDGQLRQGSQRRIEEAAALPILTVHSGEVIEFTPPPKSESSHQQ